MNSTNITIDITVIVSIIIAIVGLIAPAISSLLESFLKVKYEKEKSKLQLNKELIMHQIDVLEHFLSYTGMILNWEDQETTKKFSSYCYKVIPYLPDKSYESIKELLKLMNENEFLKAKDLFFEISSNIRVHIETLNNKLK